MARLFRVLLWVVAAVLSTGGSPSFAKRYHVSNHDVDIDVLANGDLHITETLGYSFDVGTFTYAYRKIPVRRFDDIEFVSLTSPDGPLTIDRREITDGWTRSLRLRWSFPPTETARTFRLEYIAHGALKIRDGRHVLDWSAVGDEWRVPVGSVDVTVRLPGDFGTDVTTRPEARTAVRDGATEVAFHRDRVGRRDGWRIVVEFPRLAGVAPPLWTEKRPGPARVLVPGGLSLVLLLSMIWWRVGRVVPTGERSPVASYPEPDLSVAEAACLAHLDEDRRALIAVIFDLARRGILRIEARAGSGLLGTRSFRVEAIPLGRTDDLPPWDGKVTAGLEADPQLKAFGKRRGKVSEVVRELRKGLRRRGLISTEREALRAKWLAVSVGLGLLATVFTVVVLVNVHRTLLAPALLALIAGWGATIMSSAIETRTPRSMGLAERFRRYGRNQREEIESALRSDPARGVSLLVDGLPELTLDKKVDRRWFDRVQAGVRDRSLVFALPSWIVLKDSEGNPADATLAAAAAFEAFIEAAATTMTFVGGGNGGGGGSGGAGGGGGGAG